MSLVVRKVRGVAEPHEPRVRQRLGELLVDCLHVGEVELADEDERRRLDLVEARPCIGMRAVVARVGGP